MGSYCRRSIAFKSELCPLWRSTSTTHVTVTVLLFPTTVFLNLVIAPLTPRWASIAALTVTLRLTLLPLIVRTLKHNVRLQAVQPQMTALFKRLADAKKAKDVQAQQVVAGSLANLMKQNDVSPFRPLLMPLIQMPFFLAFFWGLKSLAQLPLPQLKEGGFGWVTDLTLSDPYYVLPVTSMVLTNFALRVSFTTLVAAGGR